MSDHPSLSRRRVLLFGSMAAAMSLAGRGAVASDSPQRLSPDDPQAQALGYVEDASTVDPAAWPKIRSPEGQRCSNCSLYQGSGEWGSCAIFPGKQVAAAGWCNAWVASA